MSLTFSTPPPTRQAYARLASRSGRRRRSLPDGFTLPVQRLQLPAQATELDRLARYSRICGFGLTGTLPASYIHVLTFPLQLHLMAGPGFGLPAVGLVHTRNQIVQHRLVDVRERLTLTVWADGLRAHRTGVGFDLQAQAHTDGALVWEGRSEYLARGIRLVGPVAAQAATEHGGADDGRLPVAAVPSARWSLPADLGRRYASVSGDVNPIHLSAVTARALGFPRAIAHGMWTHARSLAAMTPLPPSFSAEVRFRRPVLLPSTVAVHRGRHDDTQVLEIRTRDDVHVRTELRSLVQP